MECWRSAGEYERRRFQAIFGLVSQSPQLLKFLFHPEIPQLRLPPEELLREALGFSSGDLILVRIAIDLWCEQGNLPLHQVFGLDSLNFKLTLQALEVLGP